jgi:hypothetical protein
MMSYEDLERKRKQRRVKEENILLIFALFTLFVLLMINKPANAQDSSNEQPEVIYEEETRYDFDAEFIDGNVQRPDGELFQGRSNAEKNSLIPIRRDFIPEMIDSVRDVL